MEPAGIEYAPALRQYRSVELRQRSCCTFIDMGHEARRHIKGEIATDILLVKSPCRQFRKSIVSHCFSPSTRWLVQRCASKFLRRSL